MNVKSGRGCLSADTQKGLCQGVQKIRRDPRDQGEKDAQSTLSLFFLKGGKGVILGPFEDELAVKQKWRTLEVWGEEKGREKLCKCDWEQRSVIWPISALT